MESQPSQSPVYTVIAIFLFCLYFGTGMAAELVRQTGQSPTRSRLCTSDPCTNTPTGEDPSDIAERKGHARSDQIREIPDDSLRWKRIRLYSDSTKPERLQMIAHYQDRTLMVLDPKTGNLSFQGSTEVHSFNIATPHNAASNLCPV